MRGFDPYPIKIVKPQFACFTGGDIQIILRNDLTQPCVLRVPGVIHHHWALGDGVQRKFVASGIGGIPGWQRIEIFREPLLVDVACWLRPRIQTLPRQAKFLQRLAVQLSDDGFCFWNERRVGCGLQVIAVHATHPALIFRPVMCEKTFGFDVGLPLIGVRLTTQRFVAVFAAKAAEKANARCALVVHDEVGIARELALAFGVDEGRKFESCCQLNQHVLPGSHIAIQRQNRMANRISRSVRLADGAVEKTDRVVALEIRCVGQHQVGKAHHLGIKSVGDNEKWNLVIARFVHGLQHVLRFGGVHRAVPRHVRHEQNQRVDFVWIAFNCVLDHGMHHAVRGEWRFP